MNHDAGLILYSGRPADFQDLVRTEPGEVIAALPKPLPMERLVDLLDDALAN